MSDSSKTTRLVARRFAVGLFFVCLVGVVVFYYQDLFRGLLSDVSDSEVVEEVVVDDRVERSIDGVKVASHTSSTVFAVMLDNAPEAWPHYGLSEANQVWEFPVEGARTRLMALYDGTALDAEMQIGPIRSVRPYFLDIAKAYDAYMVHVGGSPAALDMIAQGYVGSLNEFSASSYFWRDHKRYAPHNTMTNVEELLDAVGDRGIDLSEFVGWYYKDEVGGASAPSWVFGELAIDWVLADGVYTRHVGGQPFVDAEGDAIEAVNVVIMYAPMQVIDNVLRRKIVTVGEGKAIMYIAGEKIEGSWSRSSEGELVRFVDENGEEVRFARGTTWIEVLPKGWSINTTTTE